MKEVLNMKKATGVLFAAAALAVLLTLPVQAAEWKQSADGSYWYQRDDGSYPAGGMFNIDGVNYYFDGNGVMKTGWQYDRFTWKYFGANGALATGWQQVDGKWYYLEPENEGAMHTSWLSLNNDLYYLDESGVLQTGIFRLSDRQSGSEYVYEADSSGRIKRNQTARNGNRMLRYEDNGVIMYKNDTSNAVQSITGETSWRYLTWDEAQEGGGEQTAADKDTISDYAYELMDKYAAKYAKNVAGKKGTSKADRRSRWEDTVTRVLGPYASSSEISSYIRQVENGYYSYYSDRDYDNSDDDDYDYGDDNYDFGDDE